GAEVAWNFVFGVSDIDIYGARVDPSGNVLWAHSLYSPGGNQTGPTMVPDGSGGLIVGFQDDQSGTSDIRAVRYSGAGSFIWGAVGVSVAAGNQIEPVSTPDGSGGVIFAWRDERSGSADVWAQRITSAGAPAQGWVTDGEAVCLAAQIQAGVKVVS